MALHENLTNDNNLHFPKGFAGAGINTYPVKKATGSIEWFERELMPVASTQVSSIAAPPAETTGKIYLLDNAVGDLTVSAINWQSATTVRYTFSGSPDLSAVAANDYLICSGAGDSDHDGTFTISAVNDGSDYIEVTNAAITDATQDETTGATCNATAAEWDGANVNDWVRFGALSWESHTPTEGTMCYLADDDALYVYSGTAWVNVLSAVDTLAEVLANGNTTGGNDIIVSTGDKISFDLSGAATLEIYDDGGDSVIDHLGGSSSQLSVLSDGLLFLKGENSYISINPSPGNSISIDTPSSGALQIPDDTDPDTNVVSPSNAMMKYDSTDHQFRAYVNGGWTALVGAKSINANSLVYLDSSSEGTTDGDLTYDGDEFAHKGATGTNLSVFDGYTVNNNWYEAADRSGLIWLSYSRSGDVSMGRPMFDDFTIDGSSGDIGFEGLDTEALIWKDAGSTGATEQDWIEVTVGGVTGYVRVYATK